MRARFVAVALSTLLLGAFSVGTAASPASATVTRLCTGYAACAKAGMPSARYPSASGTMWWRMYTGHNCTNYAAYRMVRSGLPNVRPWSGGGNATYWGSSMSGITDAAPRVGAIAWWKANVSPAGSAGHVAYVERVISKNEIIVSQDSWGGDFSWARITRSGGGWPSGFVHFNDVPMVNTAKPAITGTARVGSVLTASPGTWKPVATLRYQWRMNGVNIAGATARTLTLGLPQEGKRITLRVTASKIGYPTTSVVSAATASVQPGVIRNTVVPSVSGEPRVDSTLTANPGQWNPTPDELRYQWLADGSPIEGATTSTMTADPTMIGKPLSVTVTATKSGYSAVSATSAATTPVVPGTLTLIHPPSISGVPRPGETLTLSPANVTPEATEAVQWLRAGVPVPGATGPTYRLTAADLGSRISARVGLTRAGYTSLRVRAASTPRVRAIPRLRVTTQPGVGRLVVSATVTARRVDPVDGVLQIRSRGKLLKVVPVRNGSARTRVTGLAAGTRTFRFRFQTTPTASAVALDRRITIV